MWWSTALGDRESHAVVVKAVPITGQENGAGGAGEVFAQVNQALGSKLLDVADLTERMATKCLVVTSHTIRKEAAEFLRSALGARARDGAVRLIDGDELRQLLTKHRPGQTVIEDLEFAEMRRRRVDPRRGIWRGRGKVLGCVRHLGRKWTRVSPANTSDAGRVGVLCHS